MLRSVHYSSVLRVGIAADSAALLKFGRKKQAAVLAEQALPADLAAAPAAIASELRGWQNGAEHTAQPVAIVVADHWVRLFVVTPPQNTASLADCRAAAAMRFQELYGESLANWQLQADWHAQHAFVACAMPAALVAGLLQLAKDCRWTVLSIVPQFIAAWNHWHHLLDGSAWFGVVQESRVTLAAIDRHTIRALQPVQVAAATWPDAQALSAQLAREALRVNLPAPAQLLVCGKIPGAVHGKADINTICRRLDSALPSVIGQSLSPAVAVAAAGAPAAGMPP